MPISITWSSFTCIKLESISEMQKGFANQQGGKMVFSYTESYKTQNYKYTEKQTGKTY